MRFLFLCLLLLSLVPSVVIAYPQEKYIDCLSKEQHILKGDSIPKKNIEGYCDCALTLIVDKEEDVRLSGYQCAVEFLG